MLVRTLLGAIILIASLTSSVGAQQASLTSVGASVPLVVHVPATLTITAIIPVDAERTRVEVRGNLAYRLAVVAAHVAEVRRADGGWVTARPGESVLLVVDGRRGATDHEVQCRAHAAARCELSYQVVSIDPTFPLRATAYLR